MKTASKTPYELGLKTFKSSDGIWFNPDFRNEFNGYFGNYYNTKEIAVAKYNDLMMNNEVNHTFIEAKFEGDIYFRYIGTNIWD